MAHASRPWWIIGSAAAWAHCARTPVADIDVLADEDDAAEILRATGSPYGAGSDSELFRSSVFGRFDGATLPIEVMGGLHVRSDRGWTKVVLTTREPVRIGDATIWVPSRPELILLFLRFGRPKDLARAALLGAARDER